MSENLSKTKWGVSESVITIGALGFLQFVDRVAIPDSSYDR